MVCKCLRPVFLAVDRDPDPMDEPVRWSLTVVVSQADMLQLASFTEHGDDLVWH